MPCKICIREPEPGKLYCPRCWNLFKDKPDHVEHVATLKKYYDPARDAFICHHTGVALNDTDADDPYYVSFDHLTPRRKGTLVVSARWVNDLKSDLDEYELHQVVSLYVRAKKGDNVDWSVVKFRYWKRTVTLLPAAAIREPPYRALPTECVVCRRKPYPKSIYCPVCRRLVFQGHDIRDRHEALDESWDGKLGRFVCFHTGMTLDDRDNKSPRYVSFDHLVPGVKGRLVVSAAFINTMKMDLSVEEFDLVMAGLDRHFNGAPFDRDIIKFIYWHRTKNTSP